MSLINQILVKLMSNEMYIKSLKKRGIKIGDKCSISKNITWGSEPYLISLGNNVRITNNVKFFTHDGGMWVLRNLYPELKFADKFGRIKIGNNVNIGWNVIILPNVEIGDNVIIGAGAIVTKNIPSNSVAVGVPARVIETIDEYYKKNKKDILLTKNYNNEEKKKFLEKNLK